MPRIALLGDSIFDNAPYTAGGPAVIDHLRQILPPDWSADLLAVDGAVIADVSDQLKRLTDRNTHLVLSAGGNNALMNAGVLELNVRSSGEALMYLGDVVDKFEQAYREMLSECISFGLPLTVSTIYEGFFEDTQYQKVVRIAIRTFNDAIIRAAVDNALRVIELRHVCKLAEDYANPIEPSVIGGSKIAQAIVRAVQEPLVPFNGARVSA
jgi:hypothetical protein